MAIPATGLLVGCAIGLAWLELRPWVSVAVLAGSVLAGGWAWRRGAPALLCGSVGLVFAAGGVLLLQQSWRDAWRPTLRIVFESIAHDERQALARQKRGVPADDSASVELIGVLRSDAAQTEAGSVSLRLNVIWIGRAPSARFGVAPAANPVHGGVLLTVGGALAVDRMADWRAGRRIRAPALLHRPARYLDPGVPDQERALARRGVTLVGTVKSGALVEVVARGSPLSELFASVRAFSRTAIRSSVGRWSPRSAAIVNAIVIGDRSQLDERLERRLQEAGTYHVVAISGGNIAILAGLVLIAFRIVGMLGRGAMVPAIAVLVAYGHLVGGSASVARATLMAVVYFGARALDLRGPPINTLALAAAVLVAADPLAIADPAFLLTFGATLAIVVVAVSGKWSRVPAMLRPIAAMLAASVAAEAALLPIVAAFFNRVTFAGLALNFGAIPLMAVAQVAGMAVVPLFAMSPWAAAAAGWVAHAGAEGLVRTAELVRLMPFATWRVAAPAAWAAVVYYCGLVAALLLWRCWKRHSASFQIYVLRGIATGVAACGALWILAEPWTFFATGGDRRLHVTFIDVGQGDAAFVRFPRGATMLVDAGGLGGSPSFDVGDRVVGAVLRHAGVRRLGTVAVTHGDADHAGGGTSVVTEFTPWDVWQGIPVPPSVVLQGLRSAAADAGSRLRHLQSGDEELVDGVRVLVHHPGLPDWERQRVRNDDSLVIELVWGGVSIVLTGDIGADVERTIARRFASVPLRVVKVPHHGSLTSSSEAFVRALAARVAVVSAGRGNRFGHPAPAVLARYAAVGTEIFRTDQDGAVTVDTDGRSVVLHTHTGRRRTFRRQANPGEEGS